MTSKHFTTHPLPAFAGWQAYSACVEMASRIVFYVAQRNSRLTQGCFSMTD
ncbi:MAG: hypothetical protein P4L99_26890 [Chthoniobacter sp.]|nr:hypothetical protein [Chthoniobacter sp.]